MIEDIDSPLIHAATTDNFIPLVLDNSKKGPVLVNFWSRKAGPCLRQYPILDKLIHHYDGRVLLINIDTENEFVYTKKYGVNSVPTLKIFRYGKVVDTRHGYQSEEDLTALLDKYVAKDSDLSLAEAIRLYSEGHKKQAYEKITKAIISDPDNPRLPLNMCKLLKYEERYTEALKLIESLPANIRQDPGIDQLFDLLSFHSELDIQNDIPELTEQIDKDPDNLPVLKQLIASLVVRGEYEDALQRLVALRDSERKYPREYTEISILRIFNILGTAHELVSKYRASFRHYKH